MTQGLPQDQISFELTADDIFAFHKYSLRYLPKARRKYLLGLLWTLAGMWVLIYLIFRPDPARVADWGMIAISSAVVIWLYPRSADDNMRKVIRKEVSGGIYQREVGMHQVTIDQSGVCDASAHGAECYGWPEVVGIDQDETHLFIYITRQEPVIRAIIIPKRAFFERHGALEFYQAMRRYWAPRPGEV